METKILTLMRGLSGSGKSQAAREIEQCNKGVVIVSTDDFWRGDNGNYTFDYSRIGDAHLWAQRKTEEWMKCNQPHIVVDNTNARWWEMFPYIEMAKKYSYEVNVHMVGDTNPEVIPLYAARNIHNVPIDIIQRQAKNFEKLMDPEMGYFLEKLRREIENKLKNG